MGNSEGRTPPPEFPDANVFYGSALILYADGTCVFYGMVFILHELERISNGPHRALSQSPLEIKRVDCGDF